MFGSDASPIKLKLAETLTVIEDELDKSGREPPIFFATIELFKFSEPMPLGPVIAMPPPEIAAELLAIVVLFSVRLPNPLMRIAPPIPVPAIAVLPAMVLVLKVTDPLTNEMAPPPSVVELAALLLNVDVLTITWPPDDIYIPPPFEVAVLF